MKLLVLGSTGKTGGLVVEQALANGHEVTVLVRNAGTYTHDRVRVVEGDATSPESMLQAVRGQDAVIDTIGGTTPYLRTRLEQTGAGNAIAAMQEEGVHRLIVVSMMGIGESHAQAPLWYKYLLMPTFLRGSTEDKTAMETLVAASGLDYIIARPPILKDGPATGKVQVLSGASIGHSITRADLATFLVGQIEDDRYLRSAVTVVNK